MRALIFVYIIEEVAHDQVQNALLVKNWAWSCVKAAERDLLVAYPVIDIGGIDEWGSSQFYTIL